MAQRHRHGAGSCLEHRRRQRENFLTLMHCFGLLSIQGAEDEVANLGIPNQTVRQLLYGHLRGAYGDTGVFKPDILEFQRLTREMARHGGAELPRRVLERRRLLCPAH